MIPKTFKKTSEILKKYKNNFLDVKKYSIKNRFLIVIFQKLLLDYMFLKINKRQFQCYLVVVLTQIFNQII